MNIQILGFRDLPPIVQQIPCDLRPQRRVPASQLEEERDQREREEGRS